MVYIYTGRELARIELTASPLAPLPLIYRKESSTATLDSFTQLLHMDRD